MNSNQRPSIKTSNRHQGRRMTKAETAEAKDTFLKAYALNGNILLSCRKANIDRSTFYAWQEKDEEFSIMWHQAERDFADIVLAEFVKRATTGYEKYQVSMGRIVYEETPVLDKNGNPVLNDKGKPVVRYGKPLMERVVSDNLLAMLVKRHFPEYRDKQQVDVTSNGNTMQSGVVVYLPDNGREAASNEQS